jgi:putative oxidoreductase
MHYHVCDFRLFTQDIRRKTEVFLYLPKMSPNNNKYFFLMYKKIIKTDGSKTTILIRFMVGAVFLSEGLQKFLFPALRGTGRFDTIGLPFPEFLGNFVGTFEIACGLLLLLGLFTRLAAIPLIIIMLVAIGTTKATALANDGFWEMLHGSRTDWAMLLGATFLAIKGGGKWSLDKRLARDGK